MQESGELTRHIIFPFKLCFYSGTKTNTNGDSRRLLARQHTSLHQEVLPFCLLALASVTRQLHLRTSILDF